MDKVIDNLKKGVNIAITEAEKLGKVVKEKSIQLYDVTKLKLALKDTESKLDEHYRKIGEIIYNKYIDNRDLDDDLEVCCHEIDEFIEEINELKKRIADAKDSEVCPSCGQGNEKGDDYCSKCGSKLGGDDVIQVVDVEDESKVIDIVD